MNHVTVCFFSDFSFLWEKKMRNSEGDRQEITKASEKSEGEAPEEEEEEEELVGSSSSEGRRIQGGQEHQEALGGQ